MLVLKFGGTSVGNTQAFAQVAEIIARARAQDAHVVVVTSAMSGVTNTLVHAARAAADGYEQPYREARSDLLLKHQLVAGQLIEDGVERAAYGRLIDERLRSFERLCHSIYVLGELTAAGWMWFRAWANAWPRPCWPRCCAPTASPPNGWMPPRSSSPTPTSAGPPL